MDDNSELIRVALDGCYAAERAVEESEYGTLHAALRLRIAAARHLDAVYEATGALEAPPEPDDNASNFVSLEAFNSAVRDGDGATTAVSISDMTDDELTYAVSNRVGIGLKDVIRRRQEVGN